MKKRKDYAELVLAAERVLVALVGGVGLQRVAVDERPRVERVLQASHLVLDLEQRLPRFRIDDSLEAPLVLVGLHGDEATLEQLLVGRREIGDVHLDMVAVVGRDRLARLRVPKALTAADPALRRSPYRDVHRRF